VARFGLRTGALLLILLTGMWILNGLVGSPSVVVVPTRLQLADMAAGVSAPTTANTDDPAAAAPAGSREVISLVDVPVAPVITTVPKAAPAAPTATATPTATPTPKPIAAAAPTTTPAPAPAAGPAKGGPAAAAVVAATNAERRKAGCDALSVDSRLAAAAQGHASDMARNGYFEHESQDGRDFVDREKAKGYPSPGGENIAQGQGSAAEVVADWMHSPGHRRNILNCSFTDIGVGYDSHDDYWVQDFGR
jgi:uncharacterized protein YkwD